MYIYETYVNNILQTQKVFGTFTYPSVHTVFARCVHGVRTVLAHI